MQVAPSLFLFPVVRFAVTKEFCLLGQVTILLHDIGKPRIVRFPFLLHLACPITILKPCI